MELEREWKLEKEFVYCEKTGKRCYSEREGNVALKDVRHQHRRHSKSKKIPKRKYLCPFCKTFHLTSQIEKYKTKRVKF